MEHPSYTYPAESLHTGSSLGNLLTFARLTPETNLEDLWSSLDDQYYAGQWRIDFLTGGEVLNPVNTIFRPESQETTFRGGSAAGLEISKRFFLPFPTDRQSPDSPSILQAAIFIIRLTSPVNRPVVIRHTLTFVARPGTLFTKQPAPDQASRRVQIRPQVDTFEILTAGKPSEARVVGSSATPGRHSISGETLIVDYEVAPQPGRVTEMHFILGYSPEGIDAARQTYQSCANAGALLEESSAAYSGLFLRSEILTPEPVINRGLAWAKVNSVRVLHKYRAGEAFTNDPPQDIVVIRDLAWYVLGSDYLTPEFSHNLLALAERHAFHDDGKLTEFIHANEKPPVLHDYDLNINDDTPLYVYALHHHALMCEDPDALARAYPLMKRACDYILSQAEDGLVRCHADGTNVWGICGWRNIIDGYNLTGAVTEINAECCHALECTAEAGAHLGKAGEAQSYSWHAQRLREAINSTLVSEKTGLYLLNLSDDGSRHHDLTGDLIFPVMFGIAGPEMRKNILRKLTSEEFWTPYGARTVGRNEHNYDPDSGYQLMGGVWPNLTAWIAMCAKNEEPGKLVEGMLNIYRISESKRPADFVNLVPGEFPERLHGESFLSRGMAMSPWTPPTYLWLGVEGLMGIRPTLDGLEANPCIPPEWGWIAVKNLPFRGKRVTLFLHDQVLYSNHPVKSSFPVRLGALVDVSADVDSIMCIGLKIAGSIVIFTASDREAHGNISVHDAGRTIVESIDLRGSESKLLHIPAKQRQPERVP